MTVQTPPLPFSLDPLMAEAKRRARQRRVLVALVISAVVVAGALLGFELRGPVTPPSGGVVAWGTGRGYAAGE